MNHGVRRRDAEQIVVYINMPSCGVMSSAKMHFSVGEATRLLHQHPKSAVAVVLLPNRAADVRMTKTLSFHGLEEL